MRKEIAPNHVRFMLPRKLPERLLKQLGPYIRTYKETREQIDIMMQFRTADLTKHCKSIQIFIYIQQFDLATISYQHVSILS